SYATGTPRRSGIESVAEGRRPDSCGGPHGCHLGAGNPRRAFRLGHTLIEAQSGGDHNASPVTSRSAEPGASSPPVFPSPPEGRCLNTPQILDSLAKARGGMGTRVRFPIGNRTRGFPLLRDRKSVV